jgi:hypothetical protein
MIIELIFSLLIFVGLIIAEEEILKKAKIEMTSTKVSYKEIKKWRTKSFPGIL